MLLMKFIRVKFHLGWQSCSREPTGTRAASFWPEWNRSLIRIFGDKLLCGVEKDQFLVLFAAFCCLLNESVKQRCKFSQVP